MKNILLVLCSLMVSGFTLAAESSLYDFSWLDKDKEIYVLQNRKFRKNGRFYIGGNLAKTVGSAFQDAYGASARVGYFFREEWGIESVFSKNTGSENDTAKAVREQGTVPFYRKVDSYTGAMLMWSPFYSKINTFNQVVYFDWIFGLGAASIKTEDNRNRFDSASSDSSKLTSETNTGILWTTGFRFYINENWSVRLDMTGLNYRADRTRQEEGETSTKKSSAWFGNYDLGLGLNYSF